MPELKLRRSCRLSRRKRPLQGLTADFRKTDGTQAWASTAVSSGRTPFRRLRHRRQPRDRQPVCRRRDGSCPMVSTASRSISAEIRKPLTVGSFSAPQFKRCAKMPMHSSRDGGFLSCDFLQAFYRRDQRFRGNGLIGQKVGDMRNSTRTDQAEDIGKLDVDPVVVRTPPQQLEQWRNRLHRPQLAEGAPRMCRRPNCRVLRLSRVECSVACEPNEFRNMLRLSAPGR